MNSCHILLINPPWILSNPRNVWRSVASVMPPLGLAALAAWVERAGYKATILDSHAKGMKLDAIGEWIRVHPQFDIVGITATTPLFANALDIAQLVKRICPGIEIVFGGVHSTVLSEEVLLSPYIDMAVRGEGEITLTEIMAGRRREEILGLSWKDDQGRINHNPDRPILSDLSVLPMPAYHLLPMGSYRPALGAAKRTPAIAVLATRGCSGRCSFCYRIFGTRLRYRPAAVIASEIEQLQKKYGIKEVCFYDDTFTASRREVADFCNAVSELGLDLTWSCFSRIDTFHEETFRLMKESGCHQVMFGVESYHPDILREIRKNYNAQQVKSVIRKCQEMGLETRAAFMLGNPGETEETLEGNIRFSIEIDPDLAQFNITTPFPGTEMFSWAERNGYLLTRNWNDYDLSRPIMNLPTVSPELVQKYYHSAHRRFFMRPKPIWRRIKKLLADPKTEISVAWQGLRIMVGI